MSNGIARATIVGNLTRDPELNESGRVLSLGIAVNQRRKGQSGEWEDEAHFFDVKVLGNRAQPLAGFLEKGRQVAVDARVVQERWTAKDGGNRSAVRFIADEVVVLGSRQDGGSRTSDVPSDFPAPKAPAPSDDDIPF
jgi:single-strand DNA-binding protein